MKAAGRLQDIFGRDNLFIELQDHGHPRAAPHQPDAARASPSTCRRPLLATNDSHYVHRDDAVAHDALLCVQTGSLMSDPDRFKFHGDEHYLKPAHEMRHLFDELPEACDNTLWIAERADVDDRVRQARSCPPSRCRRASRATPTTCATSPSRGPRPAGGRSSTDQIVERLAYELQVIESMGFSSYFLIVWDLIKHARDAGIRVGPGRGSAAGCAVAYTLWITDLDPIKYDLLFERFLNPSRISMPDIDMDFDSRYRDEMIRYAAERYGRDHVAQIVTFSTIKARAAVRDAARVLGYPYAVGDKVAKAMPPLVMGRDTPLYACLEPHPKYEDGYKMAADLRKMRDEDPDAAKVIEVAKGLEGLRRQDGIHAAAVVITKEPLTTYLPIQRKPEGGQDPRTGADRHPVRDARGRGARPAEDGLPGAAQPRRHHRHPGDHPAHPGHRARHRHHPARRRRHPRPALPGRLDRRVPARGRADAVAHALARPDQLRGRRRPRRPVPARARWPPTCTTTTPTGRTAGSRSSTSTPTPRSSWPTPTA